MKGLITFAIIGGIAVLGGWWFLTTKMSEDSGYSIAFACGNPNGDKQEIQIVVPIAFPHREPPRVSENGVMLWDEWVEAHWVIKDADGERVPLRRRFAGSLIPSDKVGTPDSYLVGYVTTGKDYTFDFIPSLSEGKVYRRAFKVETDGVPFKRANFTPAEDV